MGDGVGVWAMAAVAVLGTGAALVLAVALVRTRRAHARARQEHGWLLQRERENAGRAAVDAERARIARDLHDIVSHNVSVMLIQAGAARQVLTSAQADDATQALLAVEAAGRDTMAELRHLLGVLAPAAGGEEEPSLSPQPSLSRLSSLVDRIAFAGLPVEVRISGEPRPLPSGVDVTAFRVIQEALTNALRHGEGTKADVTVRYAEHSLRVEVLNDGPSVLAGGRSGPSRPESPPRPDGESRGLLGLRQRVAVLGGDLDARRRLGGGFRVRARIPLDRP